MAGTVALSGVQQVVHIPLYISGKNLAETEQGVYYTQTLNLTVGLDVTKTQELTVHVEVTSAVLGEACTHVGGGDANRSASSQRSDLLSGEFSISTACTCNNDCENAPRDGFCDDGGPGYDYAACALGTDCAVRIALEPPSLEPRADAPRAVRAGLWASFGAR